MVDGWVPGMSRSLVILTTSGRSLVRLFACAAFSSEPAFLKIFSSGRAERSWSISISSSEAMEEFDDEDDMDDVLFFFFSVSGLAHDGNGFMS